MIDAILLARRKAAYRPGRRFPGGQLGNQNVLKQDPAARRRAREITELLRECRVAIRTLKLMRGLGGPKRIARHTYIIDREGVIEERVYEVYRTLDECGRLRFVWQRIEGEGGVAPPNRTTALANS